ncbi:hypothetical protein BDQ12DRAFT_701427 [Crucibulum laeve]|uniref:DNA helicase n=1 Tax=Crucibulum laeve TaxID=68775 RepID=A0A5C3LSR3_9AGAR|nr:hypothetical protein BDQ12DRAFT_701427 [Crucibulum laeve]
MQQISQSSEDNALRVAVSNMCYAACTENDIKFLRSRVASRLHGHPTLSDPTYRNILVLTAWNSQKDRLNEIGCCHFAEDTRQTLTNFYSIDSIATEDLGRKKRKQRVKKKACNAGNMHINLQKALCNHIPGKLSLCKGMPVMIRNNDAMELCITKGQEGFLVDRDSITGPFDQLVLDTVYIQLDKLPKDIQIAGLPLNVIPMPRSNISVQCQLLDDSFVKINDQQEKQEWSMSWI